MAADTRDRRRLHDFSDVRPDKTAVLVIDMSRDFVAAGGAMASLEARDLAVRLAPFLARCRAVGLPVIYVNHVHRPGARDMGTLAVRFPSIAEGRALRAGTPGVAICDELTPQPGDLMVEKIRQSFITVDEDKKFELLLKVIDRDRILTDVSIYWFTATAGSAAHTYYERFNDPAMWAPRERSAVPVAVAVFTTDVTVLPFAAALSATAVTATSAGVAP